MNHSGHRGFPYRLCTLFALYLVQGMPYGFFLTVLPIFLREAGWSRTSLGFLSLLGLPWFLKPLWAPLVDRFSLAGLGRRKSWILPCLAASVALALLLGTTEPIAGQPVVWLLVLVFLLVFVTSTEDIAVDGLAVDLLHREERGPGNAAQVVGFKMGMLLTGGAMLAVSGAIGWRGMCWGMALLTGFVLFWVLFFPENRFSAEKGPAVRLGLRQIMRTLLSMAGRPGFGYALLLIATYKIGEAGVDAMYKIFLLDKGMPASAIGALCGGWGMAASLAGSVCGGWLGANRERLSALAGVGAIRAIPLCAIAALPFLHNPLAGPLIYPVTLAEHFAGGMITPIVFALMMDLCDRDAGATQFTALAAAELLGKMSVGALSGWVSDRIGYGGLFCAGAAISLAWPLLVVYARRRIVGCESGRQDPRC